MAKTSSKTPLLVFFLFLLFASSASASQIQWLEPRLNKTGDGPNDYECESARAADYYGIGVRLGIYFSWWTAWIANIGHPSEIGSSLDTNSVFLFASVIALVRCTITNVTTKLDCLVLLHLSNGTVFGTLSLWGYRTCCYRVEGPKGIRQFGGFGTHLRLLLSTAVAVGGVWFWMWGAPKGTDYVREDNGPCATVYTFLFTRVPVDGAIRIFNLIICILQTIYFAIMLFVSPITAFARILRLSKLFKGGQWRTPSRFRFVTGFTQRELRHIFHFLRVFSFLFLIWSMLLVEMTLNYNHVRSVLGPGGRIYFPSQLIPWIIGMFMFLRIIYKKFDLWRNPTNERASVSIPDSDSKMTKSAQSTPRSRDFPNTPLSVPPTPKKMPTVAGGVPAPAPHCDGEIDELMEGKPRWLRYLVAWLPWLSLLFSKPWRVDVEGQLQNSWHDQNWDDEKRRGASHKDSEPDSSGLSSPRDWQSSSVRSSTLPVPPTEWPRRSE